ncbi:DUF3859 domain-containing protein [Paragemmobacter straminiformis]|uniref:DUF3859 domain-containing protein n=1 Tax=Paragemmobacter straminiformis TaxID=2045119 RepID=UPI00163A9DA1|nr:DUF3859 domain-containing protein [Gemmobacter straminiformis]
MCQSFRLLLLFAPLLFCAIAVPARAELPAPYANPARAVALSVGIVCSMTVVGQKKAPRTRAGTSFQNDGVRISIKTQVIPAFEGIKFGMTFMILGQHDSYNSVTMTHPPLGPDGTTVEHWMMPINTTDLANIVVKLGSADEHPLGRWTLTTKSINGLIATTEFELVEPKPGEAHPCEFLSS